jgi:hypothetical protein
MLISPVPLQYRSKLHEHDRMPGPIYSVREWNEDGVVDRFVCEPVEERVSPESGTVFEMLAPVSDSFHPAT